MIFGNKEYKKRMSVLRSYPVNPVKFMVIDIEKNILRTKQSSKSLLNLTKEDRKKILLDLAKYITKKKKSILKENAKDVKHAVANGSAKSFVERLSLDEDAIKLICDSVRQIALGEDNLFETMSKTVQNSGITIQKKCFPLGLVVIIYESRPNVTVDAFAATFKSGNAVILKGGKEIVNTNKIFITLIRDILNKNHISEMIVQDFSGIKRDNMKLLIENENIDCLIPRGGKKLIEYIKNNAKIPVIITGASVVHAYIDADVDLKKALDVIINSKMRRVSICNALDVIVIHKDISENFLSVFVKALYKLDALEIRADKKSFSILKTLGYQKLKKALYDDFDTEFLSMTIAVCIVDSLDDAIAHIQKHSLGHSEVIITKDTDSAQRFFQDIDSACLYLNTSTQFSDGGEFGMGGEIGISTQKLHARGPFSYKELTTYKYIVDSEGSIRK